MVLDPSLLCNHELVRTSFRPCSLSSRLRFHHLRVPSPDNMMDVASARVARRRVVLVVVFSLERMSSVYLLMKDAMASSAAEPRRVDCTAMMSLGVARLRWLPLQVVIPIPIDPRGSTANACPWHPGSKQTTRDCAQDETGDAMIALCVFSKEVRFSDVTTAGIASRCC